MKSFFQSKLKHCPHIFVVTCRKMDLTGKGCYHEKIRYCFQPYKVCMGCNKEINLRSKGNWDATKVRGRLRI